MLDYNNFAQTFSNSRRTLKWSEIDYFINFIRQSLFAFKKGKTIKILDVGCGSGRLLKYLKNSKISFDYIGIDSSKLMLEEAKKEFPDNYFKTLEMTSIDKLGKKFDVIFFIASFHHIDSIKKRDYVLEISRQCLDKNGYIFVLNWNLLSPHNFEKYKNSYKENGDFEIKIGKYKRYYHGFSLKELVELYKKIGFKIVENRVFEGERNIISILTK